MESRFLLETEVAFNELSGASAWLKTHGRGNCFHNRSNRSLNRSNAVDGKVATFGLGYLLLFFISVVGIRK
jgi:hypothetical protein